MATEPLLGVGSKFGPYRIVAMLGRGGMGVVYRAEDERLRRSVALKLLAAKLGDDPGFRARFLRESQLAAATEHAGIVPVYDAGEVDGVLFIAMRYVEGRDLAAILREEGALDPPRAVGLIGQLAEALDAAHARGLVHRDVKPSNALVAQERAGERAYLVDFGITHDTTAGERLTETGQMVGTPDYLAPERIRGDAIDGRADVYSLGCVLFECLTGEAPFPRPSDLAAIYAHLEEVAPPVSERRPDLPPALDGVVGRALAKDPGDRWQTCGDLGAAARGAIETPPRDGAGPAPRTRAERLRRGRAPALLAAGGLLAIAAIAAAVVGGGGDDELTPARLAGGQVVALDAATGRIEQRLPVGTTPTALAAGRGRLWMVDAEDRTLLRLDPKDGKVDVTATGATPVDVVLTSEYVWAMNGTRREGFLTLGPVASEIVRIDPETERTRGSVLLTSGRDGVAGARDNQLAASTDAVWAVTADSSVVRIDAGSAQITGSTPGYRAFGVAAGLAGAWALGVDGSIAELDPRTGRVRRKLRLEGGSDAAAVGDTATWVTSVTTGKLWRIGRRRGDVPGSVVVGPGASEVVATARAVWVANPAAGTVTQVDPVAMSIVRVIEVGGAPRSLASDGRTVWATVTGTGKAAASRIAGVEPVDAESCEPMLGGNSGKADLLVVSDLPLQGDSRLSAAQMAQAITFVMRERRFRAGRFRLAYQSCDDALANTGNYDEARCAANGRAYGRNAKVVAVIGTFHSGCAGEVLPGLNRAKGGPVPMISPLNSFVGLTREVKGAPAGLGALYPTGRRNFVRVYPADDLQGVAFARFARDRGRKRAFVLDDGAGGYSPLIAHAFEAAARRLGLRVVGRARWNPESRSNIGLVRRIKKLNADAVLISGLPFGNTGKLVRDLRATLGPRVDLMAPDSMAPPQAMLEAAGPAALDAFVSVNGISLAHLPARGADFVKRFSRTQPGVGVEPFTLYAAQAAETLLDAIARSSGTRSSVLDELFRTNATGGLIGDISFDQRGDIKQAAATILRVVGEGAGTSIGSTAGGVVERVVTVSSSDVG